MDVRFSGQALFCQISRTELATLTSGRSVDLIVLLPKNHAVRVGVRPSQLSADRGGWQLASDPTGIWITIPRAELDQLGQTKTFAERVTRDFPVSDHEHVQVILEALPDPEIGERSVIEITPQAEPPASE
ncbi:MAG: hypothetical protein ABW171_05660 [Steroidobacter sp.]